MGMGFEDLLILKNITDIKFVYYSLALIYDSYIIPS